jgi:hypothetical protein
MVSRAFGANGVSDCEQKSRTFLIRPDKTSLQALSKSHDSCWSVFASSNQNLNKLAKRAEQGKPSAAEYLARHLKQLDGGNLEDALIALGQFSDYNMEQLLSFASNGLLSSHELSDSLTMLPLSLSDNPKSQLALLGARRRKIMQVSRRDLSQQQKLAMNAIDEFRAEIKSNN